MVETVDKSQELQSENQKHDFTGIWVPRDLYLSREYSWIEKIFIVEVNNLDKGNKGRGCFASNKHFAEHLQIKEGSVVNMITKLRKQGDIIDTRFDGRKRILILSNRLKAIMNSKLPPCKNGGSLHGDMDINNKLNNNNNFPEEDFETDVQKIFNHWNSYKGIKSQTKKNRAEDLVSWQSHNRLSSKIIIAVTPALKDDSVKDITAAIDNYAKILFGDEYFFSYTWSIVEFFTRKENSGKKSTDPCKWWQFLPDHFVESKYKRWDKPKPLRDPQPDNTELVTGWWVEWVLGKKIEQYLLSVKERNNLIELTNKVSLVRGSRDATKFEEEFKIFQYFVDFYRRGFRNDPTLPKNPITLDKMLSGDFLIKYEQYRKEFWRR